MWWSKKFWIIKAILRNKKRGGLAIPNLKQNYKDIVIKATQYWYNDRLSDKWNRIEYPTMHSKNMANSFLTKYPRIWNGVEKIGLSIVVITIAVFIFHTFHKWQLNVNQSCWDNFWIYKVHWVKHREIWAGAMAQW